MKGRDLTIINGWFYIPCRGRPYAAFAVRFGRLEDRCPLAGPSLHLDFMDNQIAKYGARSALADEWTATG